MPPPLPAVPTDMPPTNESCPCISQDGLFICRPVGGGPEELWFRSIIDGWGGGADGKPRLGPPTSGRELEDTVLEGLCSRLL